MFQWTQSASTSSTRYQPHTHSGPLQVQSDAHLSTQALNMGKDQVVSFAGTSQFTAQGVSACGLAAFNFARIGVRIEQKRKSMADVLNELSTKEVVEEIVAICAGWSSNLHLEVEEIHELPVFIKFLKLTSVEYGPPRPSFFREILENMKQIEKSTVMIITRPPEIIACFKFANSNAGPQSSTTRSTVADPVFVVFDSHPRPSHPHGAGLSFSTSIENTARTLSDVLPTMDESLYNSSDYGWQAQLLANCSAHVYVARHRHKDHDERIIQSSLSILTMRAQIAELKRENEELSADNKELLSEVDRLRASLRQEQTKAKQSTSIFRSEFLPPPVRRSFGLYSHAVAGPSLTSAARNRDDKMPSAAPSAKRTDPAPPQSRATSTTGAQSIFADNPSPVPSKSPPVIYHDGLDYDKMFNGDSRKGKWVETTKRATGTTGARSIFADNPPPVPSTSPPSYNDLDFEDLSNGGSKQGIWIGTIDLARQLQTEFDKEDRLIRREHAELAQYVQVTFQCSICMDELPEDDVAKVEECVHTMCRSCLRAFVVSKIEEHRYPIFCPMCTISAERKAGPGVISRFLIEQLGVSEKHSQILTEMELAEFTIQIHCRRCHRPASVDREDYSEAINIVCPQMDCHHVWCKKCEQEIIIEGPKHSCDGSSELAHLMKENGWKHCPNCTTPILKDYGCNHMTCISPGCNTHFCYICGGMIVRSALSQEINQAVSAHFRKCQLFEVPA